MYCYELQNVCEVITKIHTQYKVRPSTFFGAPKSDFTAALHECEAVLDYM